jgi:hypothetical protein
MSKMENLKIVLKKASKIEVCDHNALFFVFLKKKSVTIIFLHYFNNKCPGTKNKIFCDKNLKISYFIL